MFCLQNLQNHMKNHMKKNLNCFERYDALFEIKNNFQFLVLGTPEGYPALDPFNFIKVDSKFGIMTQSNSPPWRIKSRVLCKLWLYKLDMKNFSPPNRPFSDVKLPYIIIYERQVRVEVGRAAVVGPPVEAAAWCRPCLSSGGPARTVGCSRLFV